MGKAKKLPSGKWRTQVYVGKDRNGKRIMRSFTASTKRESEKLASIYLAEHNEYESSEKLSIAMERYIKAREAVISPLTVRGYKTIEKMLKDDYGAFCERELSDIGKRELQAVVSDMTERKLSPKTIANRIGFLSAVFSYHDVRFPHVKLPEKKKPVLRIPSETDVKKIIKLVEGTEMEIPVLLAAFGGLRRGEIIALTMDDVIGNSIRVNKAIVESGDGSLVEKPPKTYESNRMVEMPKYIIQKIKKRGYITKITKPRVLTNRFCRLMAANDMKGIRFHDLRHFCASYLLGLGIDEAFVMKRMGWSNSATMKNIYRHSLPEKEMSNNRIISKAMENFV